MFFHGTIPAAASPPPKASAIIPDPIKPTLVLVIVFPLSLSLSL
jgi:hypothetical protein